MAPNRNRLAAPQAVRVRVGAGSSSSPAADQGGESDTSADPLDCLSRETSPRAADPDLSSGRTSNGGAAEGGRKQSGEEPVVARRSSRSLSPIKKRTLNASTSNLAEQQANKRSKKSSDPNRRTSRSRTGTANSSTNSNTNTNSRSSSPMKTRSRSVSPIKKSTTAPAPAPTHTSIINPDIGIAPRAGAEGTKKRSVRQSSPVKAPAAEPSSAAQRKSWQLPGDYELSDDEPERELKLVGDREALLGGDEDMDRNRKRRKVSEDEQGGEDVQGGKRGGNEADIEGYLQKADGAAAGSAADAEKMRVDLEVDVGAEVAEQGVQVDLPVPEQDVSRSDEANEGEPPTYDMYDPGVKTMAGQDTHMTKTVHHTAEQSLDPESKTPTTTNLLDHEDASSLPEADTGVPGKTSPEHAEVDAATVPANIVPAATIGPINAADPQPSAEPEPEPERKSEIQAPAEDRSVAIGVEQKLEHQLVPVDASETIEQASQDTTKDIVHDGSAVDAVPPQSTEGETFPLSEPEAHVVSQSIEGPRADRAGVEEGMDVDPPAEVEQDASMADVGSTEKSIVQEQEPSIADVGAGTPRSRKGDEEEVVEDTAVAEGAMEVDEGEEELDPEAEPEFEPAPEQETTTATATTPVATSPAKPNAGTAKPAASAKTATKGKPKTAAVGKGKKGSTGAASASVADGTSKGAVAQKQAAAGTGGGVSGGEKKKPGRSKKSKLEEIRDSEKASSVSDSRASTPAPSSSATADKPSPTPTSAGAAALGGTSGSPSKAAANGGTVYCICRKPFNEDEEDVTWVGCESCDNWFHPSCVGLNEEKLDLLDVFICKKCERNTAQRTVYKKVCKRDGCNKSVAGSSSKFCSPSCAYRHSANLVSGLTNKNTLKQLAKWFISYPQPQTGISVIQHTPLSTPEPPASNSLTMSELRERGDAQISSLAEQMKAVGSAIALVQKRQQILQQAIERWEHLDNVQVRTEDEPRKKKGRGPSGAGAGAGAGDRDRPCGWERGLVLDDLGVEGWTAEVQGGANGDTEGEGEGAEGGQGTDQGESERRGTCLLPKRKCDRHQGWQKTIAASLEVELSGLNRTKENLAERINHLGVLRDERKAAEEARTSFKARLGT